MLAKVAIDLALDRLFTYEVPEALQKKLAVGQLLSVPFGHREARGFAMEIVGAPGTSRPTVDRSDVVGRDVLGAPAISIANPRASRCPNGTERSWPTASFFWSASGTS